MQNSKIITYIHKLVVNREFRSHIMFILFHIHALIIVLLVRLLSPIVLVRIGEIHSHRMGHFAANSELYLCEQYHSINVPASFYIDIFYTNKKICNYEFLKIIKKNFFILPRTLLQPIDIINKLIPGGRSHIIGQNLQQDRDVANLLDITPTQLIMSDDQRNAAKNILQKYGIHTEQKFVCLIVRDSAYLNTHFPEDNFDYHNYRDADINDFIPAIERIAQEGFLVFRMGVSVNTRLETSNPHIIDYATNGMRCDLLDIYLAENCEFCISTCTGFDALPLIYRRPIVYTNLVPVGYFISYRKNIIGIFKHHYCTIRQEYLSLAEIFESGAAYFLDTRLFLQNNIQLKPNSKTEIDDVCHEMMQRLSGNWFESADDYQINQRFWKSFSEYDNKYGNSLMLHGKFVSRIGFHFLQNNQYLFS